MVSRAADEQSSQTIQAIDPFRGLVCFSVVLMHACYRTLDPEQGPVIPGIYEYRPSVESFFILAGFLLALVLRPAEGEISVGRLLLRRFLRLAVPFWTVLLLVAVVRLVWFAVSGSMYWYRGVLPLLAELLFISDLLSLQGGLMDASHWSLTSLMQFSVIAYLGFWIVRWVFIRLGCEKHHAYTLNVFLASAFFLLVGWEVAYVTRPFALHGGFWMLPRWIGFAAAGYLAYQASVRQIPAAVVVVASASLVAIGIATGVEGVGGGNRWVWGGITTALLFILGRYNPPVSAVPPFSWLGRLGLCSFSIYLVHGPVLHYVNALGRHGWLEVVPGTLAVVALMVSGSVLAGWAFYHIVERPAALWTKRIPYRLPTAPAGADSPPAPLDLARGQVCSAEGFRNQGNRIKTHSS